MRERIDVRFQGQLGKHLPALSFSQFDPERTSRWFGLGAKIKNSAQAVLSSKSRDF
jgi:ribosomal protein S16